MKLHGFELMPGNVVQRAGYGKGIVVEASTTHLLVDFNGKCVNLAWVEAVPLTYDKLGEYAEKCNITYCWDDKQETKPYVYTVQVNGFVGECKGNVRYEHELQQIMYACGYRSTAYRPADHAAAYTDELEFKH